MTDANTRRRLVVIGVIVVALFAGLLTRLWFLQVTGGEKLAVAAQHQRNRYIPIPALRGTIYDRNGKILARTVDVTTLMVDRQNLTPADRFKLELNLAKLLNLDLAQVHKSVDNMQYQPYQPVPVATNVDFPTVVQVMEHRDQYPGLQVSQTAERIYPNNFQAADVLGYVGPINALELKAHAGQGYSQGSTIGKTGIEQTFESELRGVAGKQRVVVDNRGRAVNTVEVRAPQPGHDVQLTIDLAVQRTAEESLAQGMAGARTLVDPDTGNDYQANAGAVVVLDARDGSVVAMATNPSYDPNDFIKNVADKYLTDPNHPLINRALSPYAPGSTFKLMSSIAGLQSGAITPNTTVDDEGCITLGHQDFCNARKMAHGDVSLASALTVSSDVYFYNLGNALWNTYTKDENGDNATDHPVGYAIQNVARTYGFDAPTGIGLSGDQDQKGRIPDLAFNRALNKNNPDASSRTWRRGDSANTAVGQGDVLVTPTQLANAYAAFANGGTLYTPRLVQDLRQTSLGLPANQLGAVLHQFDPQVTRTTGLSPGVRDPIVAGLDGAVNTSDGTAYGAFQDYTGVHVIGKTGTAEAGTNENTSWFVGMMNPENDPAQQHQYVVVAMVEQGGFGANVAAPIVRRVIDFLNGNANPPAVTVAPAVDNEVSR